jgi:hypothetical protein
MHRSDEAVICIENFFKVCIILLFPLQSRKTLSFTYVSRSPALFNGDFFMNLYSVAFTYVSRSPALFNVDFFMNLYSVDSNEAMKRGMKRKMLNRFNF